MRPSSERAVLISVIAFALVSAVVIATVYLSLRETSTQEIVRTWRPSVVMVTCHFLNKDGTGLLKVGTGMLVNDRNGGVSVLTHNAMFTDQNHAAISCTVTDDSDLSITIDPQAFSRPQAFMTALIQMPADQAASLQKRAMAGTKCTHNAMGNSIVVLGYTNTVTAPMVATDGMLAGYDMGDRYLTTAFVDEGLAGGVAIDATQNCYLGMVGRAFAGGSGGLSEIWKWQNFESEIGK